jgi:hypothetical protein
MPKFDNKKHKQKKAGFRQPFFNQRSMLNFSYNVSGAMSALSVHAVVLPSIIALVNKFKSDNGLKISHEMFNF